MLKNGYWCFVGTPIPAAETNDVGLAKEDLEKWREKLDYRDILIADSIFKPLITELQGIAGWKRPRNSELPEWQKEENRQLTLTRGFLIIIYVIYFFFLKGHNERRIGDVKKKFRILEKKYRGSWESLKLNNEFILALENINQFPKLVASYILGKENLEYLNEFNSWIHGSSYIPLYTEEDLAIQQEAYDNPESVSNFLINVKKNCFIIIILIFHFYKIISIEN